MQLQEIETNDLLNKEAAAKKLTISTRLLHNKIHSGEIPYVRLGKFIRFLRSDLDAYIESHRVPGGGRQ